MSKTITKLLTLVLLIFGILFLSNNVYAREIKSVEELGKLIVRENPNAESAYVIGDYVFTTNHRLTIQDVMLAARSIKAEDIKKLCRNRRI